MKAKSQDKKPIKKILNVRQSKALGNEFQQLLQDHSKTSEAFKHIFKLKHNRGRKFLHPNPNKLGTLELKLNGPQSKQHLLNKAKGRIIDESFDDKYFILPEEEIRFYQKKVDVREHFRLEALRKKKINFKDLELKKVYSGKPIKNWLGIILKHRDLFPLKNFRELRKMRLKEDRIAQRRR